MQVLDLNYGNLINDFNYNRIDIVETGTGNQEKIKNTREDKRVGD